MKVGAKTPRTRVVAAFTLPEVPVIVSVFVPRLAALLDVSTNRELPAVGFGEKDAVTPLGNPETARLTLPVNPYSGFTLM